MQVLFHSRQNLARYDEELQFYGVFSKIHDFSIGRKSQLQPPVKQKLGFLSPNFWLLNTMVTSKRPTIISKIALNFGEIEPLV